MSYVNKIKTYKKLFKSRIYKYKSYKIAINNLYNKMNNTLKTILVREIQGYQYNFS